MNLKFIIITACFITSFTASFCDVWFLGVKGTAEMVLLWFPVILSSLLIFSWVQIDAAERNYRPSPLLNLGIIGLAFVFVPIYLSKSRPAGTKAKALGLFLIVFLGYIAVSYAGSEFAQYLPLLGRKA